MSFTVAGTSFRYASVTNLCFSLSSGRPFYIVSPTQLRVHYFFGVPPCMSSCSVFWPTTGSAMRGAYLPTSLIFLVSFCITISRAVEWASTSLATVPLAIRSPYFNVWQETADGGNGGKPLTSTGDRWPVMWNKHVSVLSFLMSSSNTWAKITGWAGFVRVDGQVYRWQGTWSSLNTTQTIQNSIRMSPTRTVIEANAGPVKLTLTFLTPVEVRHCLLCPSAMLQVSNLFIAFGLDQAVFCLQLSCSRCIVNRRSASQCSTLFWYHWR